MLTSSFCDVGLFGFWGAIRKSHPSGLGAVSLRNARLGAAGKGCFPESARGRKDAVFHRTAGALRMAKTRCPRSRRGPQNGSIQPRACGHLSGRPGTDMLCRSLCVGSQQLQGTDNTTFEQRTAVGRKPPVAISGAGWEVAGVGAWPGRAINTSRGFVTRLPAAATLRL